MTYILKVLMPVPLSHIPSRLVLCARMASW